MTRERTLAREVAASQIPSGEKQSLPAGTRVQIWLNAADEPAAPPPGATVVLFTAIVIAISAACGAGIALILCYWLFRLVLDRRRLAAWESAWALTGPRWTTRR